MRPRLLLLALAALAGAATASLPSLASGTSPPASASFTAVDFAWQASGSSSTQVTIAPGGTVSFSYPSGSSDHNADFAGGLQPSSCSQTAGPGSGAVPPLPHSATGPGWSGTCTFDTPGTYTFHCDLHPFMTGTVAVQGAGTTTGTTTTPPRSTTTTTPTTVTTSTTSPSPPTTTTSEAPTTGADMITPPSAGTTSTTTPPSPITVTSPTRLGSPLASGANAVSVPDSQHGARVRGSVRVSSAGAGGRLEVNVLISSRHPHIRVGSLLRRSLHAGLVPFSVRLNAATRTALDRHRRLVIVVRMTLVSKSGVSAAASRTVVLSV